jgi:hypothetical protein
VDYAVKKARVEHLHAIADGEVLPEDDDPTLVSVWTSSVRRPSREMSSTIPSATRKSASFDRLQVENGRPCSTGVDVVSFTS